jgi:drug/metabolite transporter (DMT)-like permease
MNKVKGMIIIMFASGIFGLVPLFAKVGMENGMNTYTLLLLRCFFATILLLLYMKIKGIDYKVDKKFLVELGVVSFLCYGLMMYTLVSSYKYIPTGIATTLHFVYPAAVLIGSSLFYREKFTIEKAATVCAAIFGIYLLSADSGGFHIELKGILLALASGIFYAIYILKASHGRIREMNSFVLVYYLSGFNIFYFIIFSAVTGNLNFDITVTGYVDVILLSFVSILAMSLFKTGLNYVSSCSASILSTFEPLTSIVIGVVAFGEPFTGRSIAGTIIIIGAVVYISFAERNISSDVDRVEEMQ